MKRWRAWRLLLLAGWAACALAGPPPRTGLEMMSPQLQAMQQDDTLNPGMLWVQEGRARWREPAGAARRACAHCHGEDLAVAMRGVAASHPAWDAAFSRPVTLGQRIAQCRQRHQGLPPAQTSPPDDEVGLALQAALAYASRGMPVTPPPDPGLQAWQQRGQTLWRQRMGQLDLSCAQCHDERAGLRLGGALIPPGNALGYPTYRLEWQALGSLQRRLRNCMTGVRAQPFSPQDDEATALEVFLHWRDRGLPMQSPAVRP